MRLTIVAATGRIGQQLHRQALSAEHRITVLVRNPSRLVLPAERVFTADLTAADPTDLRPAVSDADAVLSCPGPRSLAEAGVTAPGIGAITAAMAATGTRRIVAVSSGTVGTVASPHRPNPPFSAPVTWTGPSSGRHG
jgi:uncharacterized protein YbjT (DUF2867 family)